MRNGRKAILTSATVALVVFGTVLLVTRTARGPEAVGTPDSPSSSEDDSQETGRADGATTVGNITFHPELRKAEPALAAPAGERSNNVVALPGAAPMQSLLTPTSEPDEGEIARLSLQAAPWNRKEYTELLQERAAIEGAFLAVRETALSTEGQDARNRIYGQWRQDHSRRMRQIEMRTEEIRAERVPVKPRADVTQRVKEAVLLDQSLLKVEDYPAVFHLAETIERRIRWGREDEVTWHGLFDARDRLEKIIYDEEHWVERPGVSKPYHPPR